MKKILALFLILVVMLVGCSSEVELPFEASDTAQEIVSENDLSFGEVTVELEEIELADDTEVFIDIIGNLTNNSKDEIEIIILTFAIYDPEGVRLTTASAVIENIASGEVWKYEGKAHISNDEYGSYELVDVLVSP